MDKLKIKLTGESPNETRDGSQKLISELMRNIKDISTNVVLSYKLEVVYYVPEEIHKTREGSN